MHHRQPPLLLTLLLLTLPWLGAIAQAAPLDPAQVPAPLRPWVDWVLGDDDRRACALGGDGEPLCVWPGRLQLDLGAEGGRFSQPWRLDAPDWVLLPGEAGVWPQQVSDADGKALAVVARDGRPAVRLGPGEHRLTGSFQWPLPPDGLALPPLTGLVSLSLHGVPVPNPRVDADGRLWLAGDGAAAAAASAAEPDALVLDVARLIDDDIPLRVTTRLALDVAGEPREVRLGPVPLEGGIPLALEAPLPARLENDGTLVVQLRPGRWTLNLTTYHPDPVAGLGLGERAAPWPAQEVWAFQAHPDLRQVELTGATAIDPSQTRLPPEWQRLPAFLLRPGERLDLTQVQRGAVGSDRLQLARELRLDFGGGGFSLRDHISGNLEGSSAWRLEAQPGLTLGQVRVDGEPRVITRLPGAGEDGPRGIEVRQGRIDLIADARLDGVATGLVTRLPVSGWALGFEGIQTRLQLPPGWDLLAVDGVDNLPGSWLARWSLLDIFLVLIAALAIGRLWGWGWGLLALVALVLTWQEPGAPRTIWLQVLVAAALLRVLPPQPTRRAFAWLRTLVGLYYRAALLVLAVIALPFLVTEMRDGLFPQLDHPGSRHGLSYPGAGVAQWESAAPPAEQAMDEVEAMSPRRDKFAASLAAPMSPAPLPTLDPAARVQTGAGVPDWSWRAFTLGWNGPVAADQQVRLWLLPPLAALPLALLRVVLVLVLGLRLAGLLGRPARGEGHPASPAAASAALLLLGLVLLAPSPAVVAQPAADRGPAAATPTTGFPPAELLEELRTRLLAAPDCAPDCVAIPSLQIAASATELRLLLGVDAAAAVALPIPGSVDGWRPTVIELDGAPLDALRRGDDGALLLPLTAGRHRLLLSGPLSAAAQQVELPLPLRPHLVSAAIDAPWTLDGVDPFGRPGVQLRLLREQPAVADTDAEAPDAGLLPPLLQVTRTLRLGLDWTLTTRVERLSPAIAAVSLRIPLLPGEAVTSPGRQIADGEILVALPPGQIADAWQATLQPVDGLHLSASKDPRITEQWQIEVSPLWHLDTSGIPPVQNLDPAAHWLPTWRPWPGEGLDLRISRPEGVPGPTLTLDRSLYSLSPGRRGTEASLALTLRASQGGRHRLRLPEGAELTRVTIDGQTRPLLLQAGMLDLPIVPGSQQVEITWRDPAPIATAFRPAPLGLGTPGVNAETLVQPAADRWVLWAQGPGIGPAVLFWGLLAVLVLIAATLARLRLTPLSFLDWLLLGIGLSQAGVWVAVLVVLWLFALGLRRRLGAQTTPWQFNLAQIGLVLLTVAALIGLVTAVEQGLLGAPAMQIAGNDSGPGALQWYLDRSPAETLPVSVVSVPIWVYRALMLGWALWLALRLLAWLRWGWQGFAEPGLWAESRPRPAPAAAPGDRDGLSVDL